MRRAQIDILSLYSVQVPQLRRSCVRDESIGSSPQCRALDSLHPRRVGPTQSPHAGQFPHPLARRNALAYLSLRNCHRPKLTPTNRAMLAHRRLLNLEIDSFHVVINANTTV
jgi:hypothetical protein